MKPDEIRRAAEPLMEPGEVVELAAVSTLGKFNLAKNLALATATAVATLGMVSIMSTPKAQPVVLTTRRFLALGIKAALADKPDSKIVTAVQRADLRARPAKRVALYFAVDVTDPEGKKLVRMKFSFFNGADARAFSDALGRPALPGAA